MTSLCNLILITGSRYCKTVTTGSPCCCDIFTCVALAWKISEPGEGESESCKCILFVARMEEYAELPWSETLSYLSRLVMSQSLNKSLTFSWNAITVKTLNSVCIEHALLRFQSRAFTRSNVMYHTEDDILKRHDPFFLYFWSVRWYKSQQQIRFY